MKKLKNAFTLIELLAVIIILAIVALVATPIVLNVVEDAKESARVSKLKLYADNVKLKASEDYFAKGGNIDGEIDTTTINDASTSCEKAYYTNGSVYLSNCTVDGDTVEYYANGETTDEKPANWDTLIAGLPAPVTTEIEDGTPIYYNPTLGTKCTNYDPANSTTGTKTGCLKFYAFNVDKNSTTIDLILDHNTSTNITYNASGENTDADAAFKARLASDTTGWISEGNVRLITAEEVAAIVENNTFDVNNRDTYFYFDAKNAANWQTPVANTSTPSNYAWLYDNTYQCKQYGCNNEDNTTYSGNYNYGYWTGSPVASSIRVWNVYRHGSLSSSLAYDALYGVRPVISLLKSNAL